MLLRELRQLNAKDWKYNDCIYLIDFTSEVMDSFVLDAARIASASLPLSGVGLAHATMAHEAFAKPELLSKAQELLVGASSRRSEENLSFSLDLMEILLRHPLNRKWLVEVSDFSVAVRNCLTALSVA